MNAKLFKQLIKEAVREAVREEIGVLLLEQKKQALSEGAVSFTSADIPIGIGADVKSALRSKMGAMFGHEQPTRSDLKIIDATDPSTGEKVNPYLAFINDAAANMTAHDRSGLRNLE